MFYGVQTLLQLLPPEVFASKPVPGQAWSDALRRKSRTSPGSSGAACCSMWPAISSPRPRSKQLLDEMAAQKLNTLHLHLTDDQGWRIEIKKYPRLDAGRRVAGRGRVRAGPEAQHGLWPGRTLWRLLHAGGHSRDRRLCRGPAHHHRAGDRNARAFLRGAGGVSRAELYRRTLHAEHQRRGLRGRSIARARIETFEFLQNVLAEVCELFPGKYIHIGGDEVPKANWKKCERCQARIQKEGLKNEHELQSYFIRRIEKFINAPGPHPDRLERNPRGRPGPKRRGDGLDWRGGRGRRRRARRGHVAYQVLLPGLLPIHQPRHRAQGHRRLSAA